MSVSRISRRSALWGAVATCAVLAAGPVAAQSGQPIKLVVGYAAGGPVDAAARLFAAEWTKALGQQVIVDNRVVGALGLN